MIKSAKKFYLFIAFIVALFTLTSCIVVNNHKVQLEKTEFELREGQTANAVAWVTKDAEKVDVEVGYQSYDPSIATYIDGKITAVKAGEVRIKAYIVDNPKIYTVASVKVVVDDSQQVEFDYKKQMIVGDSQTIQYNFEIEKDRVLTFTSSNDKVATVDETGKVMALSKGETTITTKVESLYDRGSYKTYQLVITVGYVNYEISYVLNGGVNNPDNSASYAIEELPIELYNPRRAGFTFLGWFDNPEYEGEAIESIVEGTTGVLTLYAKWSAADYQIEYNLNGGKNNKDNPDGYSLGGLPITLYEPTKNGYTFIGWYNGNEQIKEIKQGTTGNISVEAKWKVNTYTITYNLNQGENNLENPTTYTVEELAILLKEPTRRGYVFTGWVLNGKVVTEIEKETTGDLVLEATWKAISYSITLNTVGGTLQTSIQPTYTVEDDTIYLPYVTKNGYTFLGWYENAEYTGNVVTEIATESTGNQTFYAKWNINTYTITTSLNGGTPVSDIPTTYTVESETIVLPEVEKTGYTFLGWYENGTKVESIAKGNYKNYELVAMFKTIEYTVTYNLDGGMLDTPNKTTFTIETETFTFSNPSKVGYTFEGWFNGKNEKVTSVEQGTAQDITLNAKWTVNTYTVTFESNGGSTVDAIDFTVEQEITSFATPTRSGYTFKGWFNGETKVENIEKGTTGNVTVTASWEVINYTITYELANGTNATTNPATYTVEDEVIFANPTKTGYNFVNWSQAKIEKGTTGNVTVTASWEVINYTITYELANGTNATTNPAVYTYVTETITLAAPTKEGYTFLGWYDNAECSGTAITEIAKGSTGNKTFYASWKVGTFTVTYELNGGQFAYLSREELAADFLKDYNTFAKKSYTTVASIHSDSNKTNFWKNSAMREKWLWIWNEIKDAAKTQNQETTYIDDLITGTQYSGYAMQNIVIYLLGINSSLWNSNYKAEYGGLSSIYTTIDATKLSANGYISYMNSHENDTFSIGTNAVLPTPYKQGYTFAGWYLDEACTNQVKENITTTTKLYASWIINTYTINYELNEGKWEDANNVSELDLRNAELLYKFNIGRYLGYDATGANASIHNKKPATYFYYIALKATEVEGLYQIIQIANGNANITVDFDLVIMWHSGLTNAELKTTLTSVYNKRSTNVNQYVVLENVPSAASTSCDIQVSIYKKDTFDMQKRPNDTANIGTPITLTTPLKDGYVFEGWYLSSDFSGNSVTEVTESTTVYAKWELVAQSHTITYNLNGGVGNNLPTEFIEGVGTSLVNPTRESYEFAGWYTNSECTGTPITAIGTDVNSDVVLYAKWILICEVNFEYNGGQLNYQTRDDLIEDLITDLNIVTGKSYTAESYASLGSWSEINGYLLFTSTSHPEIRTKWLWLARFFSENAGCTNNKNAYKAILKYDTLKDLNGESTNHIYAITYEIRGFVGNIHYTKNSSYPSANYADSTIANSVWPYLNVSTLTVREGYVLPTNLYKEGYEFKGWYDNSELTGQPITTISTSTTVYAKFDLLKRIVTFKDANEILYTQEVENGLKATLPAQPTKDGYTFVEWQLNDSSFDFNTQITANIVLVAKWMAMNYNITYNLDGGENATENPIEYTIESDEIVLANPTKDGYVFVGWFNGEKQITTIPANSTGDLELTAKWLQSVAMLSFPAGNSSDKVGSYTATWNAISGGNEWRIANFNNNSFSNNWTYIKCGRKGNASVASITNAKSYNQKIVQIIVTFDAITTANVNSIKLYISKDSAFTNILETINIDVASITKGDFTIELPNSYSGCFYKLEFDCASAGSNGIITISKVEYLGLPLTDSDKLELDASDISVNETANEEFELPILGSNGSTISWTSSNQEVIRINGSTATVTRGNVDNTVTLTATLNLNGIEKVVTFDVNVPKVKLIYTVTFDTDGGNAIESQTVNKEESAVKPEDPTKEGYTFVEWQLNGVTYSFTESVTDDITLKAVWIKNMPQLEHQGTETDPYNVADAIKVAEQLGSGEFNDSVVYVKGIIKSISYSTTYKNYEIVIIDESNSNVEFKLYRTIKGELIETPYQNDVIVAKGYITNYNGNTPELAPNNSVTPSIENVTRGKSDVKFTYDENAVTFNRETTDNTNGTDVVFTATAKEGYIIQSVTVNGVTITCVDGKYTCVIEGNLEVIITTKEEGTTTTNPVATFNLGTDGETKHFDGSAKTEYTEIVNDYVLKLTNGDKFYTGARDAQGNGCIKLGTGSAAGSFSFTVADDVQKVIIYVAKYKTNAASIKINGGTAQVLTKNSNNGEYDCIEIDTSTNKTISFAVSSGNRAMVNTIEFYN